MEFLSPNRKALVGCIMFGSCWNLLWVIEWDITRLICHVLIGHGLARLRPSYDSKWLSLLYLIQVLRKSFGSQKKHKFRAFRYGFPVSERLLFTQIDGSVLMFRVAHKKKSNRVAGWKTYHDRYLFSSQFRRCFLANLSHDLKELKKLNLDHQEIWTW